MNPTEVRLSPHYLLSDFLGNHSVYSRGFRNMLDPDDPELPLKLRNARALCTELLEPLLEQAGPMSISYGYIAPHVSDKIVTYQDPRQPSHHMWNLGAAADICIHEWTNHAPDNDDAETAPIALALEIDKAAYPYSRIITYSESPYVCVAISAREITDGTPRKAFYENRYAGQPKTKPVYKSHATPQSREKLRQSITGTDNALPFGWRGAGYPTYHGGGRKQFQHTRVSRYTMVSDWLFDLQSIANGAKNIPALTNAPTMAAFAAAGRAYDSLITTLQVNRLSIVQGYVAPSNPYCLHRWADGDVVFRLALPDGVTYHDVMMHLIFGKGDGIRTAVEVEEGIVEITVKV